MRSILDKIKLIGKSPMALYYIDKEVDAVNTAEEKAGGEQSLTFLILDSYTNFVFFSQVKICLRT